MPGAAGETVVAFPHLIFICLGDGTGGSHRRLAVPAWSLPVSSRLTTLATPRTEEPDAAAHRVLRRTAELPALPARPGLPDGRSPAPSRSMAIDAHDLYRFAEGGEPLLRGASLRIARGELIALVGPDPAAARALLDCLTGIAVPDGGVVTVCGEQMSHRPAPERARLRARRFGAMGEPSSLLPGYTIAHNLLAAMATRGVIRKAWASELLTRARLAHRRDALPAALSPAEHLRAELALALAHAPDILLVDERADDTLAEESEQLIGFYRDSLAAGLTIIVQTADPEMAAAATRALIVVRGTIHEA